ncbi:3585_t:CDS:2, partial [Ambispora leptoticha]
RKHAENNDGGDGRGVEKYLSEELDEPMKKTENIVLAENKKAKIAEVRQLEENQELEKVKHDPLPKTTIPENFELNWVNKNTYFVLSPTQLEKIKKTAEQKLNLESNPGMEQLNPLTGLIEQETAADKVGIPLAPEPMFYAKYLLEKLGPKIAIMVKGAEYSKELDLLLPQLESLGGKGRIIILSETALTEVIDFAPTGLFWRCHAALIEHSKLVLELAKLGLPQISSFESLFIAGDKSFLAILKERDTTGTIPKTYVLSKNNLAQNLSWLEKDQTVLKPGDLARGEGILFGKNFTNEEWEKKIRKAMSSNEEWILQKLCYLSKTKDGKYQDIVVFLADGVVRGISSRVSDHEIVNIAQGGNRQAVVLDFENYNKLKDLVEKRKISRFINELIEEKLQATEKKEKEQLRRQLIKGYQAVAKSQKRKAEDEI